jgi:hypothetical protein
VYVEDLFLVIREHAVASRCFGRHSHEPFDGLLSSEWHQNFITNVGNHVMAGKQLSTNQAQTILKLVGRIRYPLIRQGMIREDELDHMLRQPEFRRPLYTSANIPREVRYLGDNVLGFRSKQNDIIAARIRDLNVLNTNDWAGFRNVQRMLPYAHFNWAQRIWLVPVMRHNLDRVMALINEYRFNTDPAVTAYLRLARQSRDQPSAVALVDDVILANVCDNPLLAGWVTEVGAGTML